MTSSHEGRYSEQLIRAYSVQQTLVINKRLTPTSLMALIIRKRSLVRLHLAVKRFAAFTLISACSGKIVPVATVIPITPLNDTGLLSCMSAEWQALPCNDTAVEAGQDGQFGRDNQSQQQLTKLGNGIAGFDFTKLNAFGQPLVDQSQAWQPGSAGDNSATMTWDCVLDHVTNLVWEVKSDVASTMRFSGHTYSWYEPSALGNGGVAGTANGGNCTATNCDTSSYTETLNAAALCGRSNWRLPEIAELLSIADQSTANPPLDLNYFPNSSFNAYWSAQTVAFNPELAWYVYFTSAGNSIITKSSLAHIRLVSGGANR